MITTILAPWPSIQAWGWNFFYLLLFFVKIVDKDGISSTTLKEKEIAKKQPVHHEGKTGSNN